MMAGQVTQISARQREIERLIRDGRTAFKDGTVLRFTIRYHNSDDSYTYTALRMDNRWWLSGNGGDMTWSRLVRFMLTRGVVTELWKAESWERIY
jgi:hypothetical protein